MRFPGTLLEFQAQFADYAARGRVVVGLNSPVLGESASRAPEQNRFGGVETPAVTPDGVILGHRAPLPAVTPQSEAQWGAI